MRVGLVLGAGGIVGASWLIGALEAIEAETGWSAQDAERIVGTSAGSVIGVVIASGVSAAYLSAYSSGEPLDGFAEAESRAEAIGEALANRQTGAEYRLVRALPPIGPGSWRLAVDTLVHPRRHPSGLRLAAWLPRGFISSDPLRDIVRRYVDGDWPEHPSFWAVAADYATGRRVAFGSDGAPVTEATEAVAASCAIPGFYHPVKIAGRRYVDGGVCSSSNLDLLAGENLDLVICLNPMSSHAAAIGSGSSPGERFAARARASAGRKLAAEASAVRAGGTRVLVLEPSGEDLAAMGLNLLTARRRAQVIAQARRSVAAELGRLREHSARLPGDAPAVAPVRARVAPPRSAPDTRRSDVA